MSDDVFPEGEARIAAALREVGLEPQDADRMTLFYSGGMKRKLSLAIAFVVAPKVAFLDEPTAGVDAA